jgi:group I intron endonuclease
MFYCYKMTNLINGKVYVGKTNNTGVRWNAHKSRANSPNDSRYNYPVSCAIRKYGAENFEFDILISCKTELEINAYEEYYIALYRSNINKYGKDFGYNLTDGGEGTVGWKHTDGTRKKMSASHTGMKHTEETLRKIGSANKKFRPTETHINSISGENSNSAKLTWEIVGKIREENAKGTPRKQLAIKYEVCVQNIDLIVSYRSWKNVPKI